MKHFAPLRLALMTMTLTASLGGALAEPRDTDAALRTMATAEVLAEALTRFGDDASAKAAEARGMLARARQAEAAGRLDEAAGLASTAYALLREELRKASARSSVPTATAAADTAARLPAGYAARREAALELRKAVLRVSAEKHVAADGIAAFDSALASADAHAAAGRGEQAGAELKLAYESIKKQLVELRSGDTLVRSLKFERPEDEFNYELDRNETFAMLVELLAGEARSGERARAFLEKARSLRAAADEAGRRGDFSGGIGLLENSSREYQKVIRNAGILIPG